MRKRSPWKISLYTLIAAKGSFSLLLLFFYLFEYRPELEETVFVSENPTRLPDTLKIVSWNIGYAGLGENMDFFADGGRGVRDTKTRTAANLSHIISTLRAIDADIMLLQEVDSNAHRTYGILEVDSLRKAFPDHTLTFAYTYKTLWVPVPIREPMGGVRSGLVILSRAVPLEVIRYQYPSQHSFPKRMFYLKRALMAAHFLTPAGDTVLIANTHNSAYEPGNMREEEVNFLHELLESRHATGIRSVTGGDWNQFPPLYIPSQAELSNRYYVPYPIPEDLFDDKWVFAYDRRYPTLRYLDRPYLPGTVTTTTDFFLVSDDLEILSVETLPENFRASDHNPVVLQVVIPPRL